MIFHIFFKAMHNIINMAIILKNIPKEPGIYMFKDSDGKVIYVGKAKSLRQRVSSYFRKDNGESIKTEFLRKQIEDIDYIIMPNETDALILENRMIKKHNPKYNIRLKDAKTYSYIVLTAEDYPRMMMSRKPPKKGEWFGPYTEGMKRRETMLLAQKIFKLRTCRKLPKKECLNYHIGLCTAPCIGAITKRDYNAQVERASRFLKGDTKEAEKKLRIEMKEASESQNYETAIEKRNQIEAIAILKQKQNVEHSIGEDWDIWAMVGNENEIIMEMFSVKKGIISGRKNYTIDNYDDAKRHFFIRYYSENAIPNDIILSEKIWEDDDELESMQEYFSIKRKRSVKIVVPQRGEKKRLLDITIQNALQRTTINSASLKLKDILNLPYPPRIVECFDMSNLQQDHIVGGMTRWIGDEPDKRGYRRFEIKTIKDGPDDVGAMKEAVFRRYRRLKDEGKDYPDMIVIDGGKGQLNASLESLKELGLQIPIIALAKKNEEIYVPRQDEPLRYNKNSEPMLYLRKIRDYTHRYALSYNKKKREMSFRNQTKDSLKRRA
jgi:excinuclease ABC subunit C